MLVYRAVRIINFAHAAAGYLAVMLYLLLRVIENWSFCLDLRILALTARRVLSGDGVTQTGHATNEMFTGSHDHAGR